METLCFLLGVITFKRETLIKVRGDKSISKAAKDIGITPQMLGAIERGVRTPSLPLARKIADYYGICIYIFFDDFGHDMCPKRNTKSTAIQADYNSALCIIGMNEVS